MKGKRMVTLRVRDDLRDESTEHDIEVSEEVAKAVMMLEAFYTKWQIARWEKRFDDAEEVLDAASEYSASLPPHVSAESTRVHGIRPPTIFAPHLKETYKRLTATKH